MLRNLTQLEHIVENKICRFICDNDTPLNIAKEALFQFQKYIGQIEDMAKKNQQQQQQDASKVEPINEEESYSKQIS